MLLYVIIRIILKTDLFCFQENRTFFFDCKLGKYCLKPSLFIMGRFLLSIGKGLNVVIAPVWGRPICIK